ncbi:MAG: MATE family efflux transporter, partial [Epulopiscium sp. Nuni2H_MBin001]
VIDIAGPSTVERILVSMVNAMDTMMVGVLGSAAIASIGITQQPVLLVLALIISLNVGVTAVVARRCGEENYEAANTVLRQSIILILLTTLVISSISFYFAPNMLSLMGGGPEILDDGVSYFRVVLIGMCFNALSLNITAAQRGAGNTRVSMRVNVVANLVNLCFNFLLIEGRFGFPALGVTGAAVSTVMGYIVAFCIAFSSLLNPNGRLKLSKGDSWKLDWPTIKSILGISSSSFIEQCCMRLGFIIYVRLVTSLGVIAYATHQICITFVNMTFSVGEGIGIAASSLVGRNLGAKRPDLSIVYGKVCQRIGGFISFCLLIFYIFNRYSLMGLFSDEAEVIALGGTVIIIAALAVPLQTSQTILAGALRGSGDTKFIAKTSFLSVLLIRPATTFFCCNILQIGLIGAWIGFFVDQFIRFSLIYMRFAKGEWTRIKV